MHLIAFGAAAVRNSSNARPTVIAAIRWPIPAPIGRRSRSRRIKIWIRSRPAIREVEFAIRRRAELAEVGPDNIKLFADHLIEAGHLAEAEVEELKKEVQKIVEDAVAFASQSPQPTMEAAWGHLNCNHRHEILM